MGFDKGDIFCLRANKREYYLVGDGNSEGFYFPLNGRSTKPVHVDDFETGPFKAEKISNVKTDQSTNYVLSIIRPNLSNIVEASKKGFDNPIVNDCVNFNICAELYFNQSEHSEYIDLNVSFDHENKCLITSEDVIDVKEIARLGFGNMKIYRNNLDSIPKINPDIEHISEKTCKQLLDYNMVPYNGKPIKVHNYKPKVNMKKDHKDNEIKSFAGVYKALNHNFRVLSKINACKYKIRWIMPRLITAPSKEVTNRMLYSIVKNERLNYLISQITEDNSDSRIYFVGEFARKEFKNANEGNEHSDSVEVVIKDSKSTIIDNPFFKENRDENNYWMPDENTRIKIDFWEKLHPNKKQFEIKDIFANQHVNINQFAYRFGGIMLYYYDPIFSAKEIELFNKEGKPEVILSELINSSNETEKMLGTNALKYINDVYSPLLDSKIKKHITKYKPSLDFENVVEQLRMYGNIRQLSSVKRESSLWTH